MGFKDYRNEDAIDMLADLIDPALVILQDQDVRFLAQQGNTLKVARLVMKKHPRTLLEILARMDGVDVEDYSISAPQILIKLLKLMEDKDLMYFFGLARAGANDVFSGSATENTEESEPSDASEDTTKQG